MIHPSAAGGYYVRWRIPVGSVKSRMNLARYPNITDIATEERIGILSLLMSIFLVFDSESYHSSDSEVGDNDDCCGAQWLDITTDDRVVAGSNPTRDASNFRLVRLPHMACVFRMIHYKPLVPFIWLPCQRK